MDLEKLKGDLRAEIARLQAILAAAEGATAAGGTTRGHDGVEKRWAKSSMSPAVGQMIGRGESSQPATEPSRRARARRSEESKVVNSLVTKRRHRNDELKATKDKRQQAKLRADIKKLDGEIREAQAKLKAAKE